ncbi:hypothetical protein TRIATDRAFT_35020 [Trichoderma atroviride IMI 206040]|uniref:F-box domain-containing protein n=1 Tax=Hypocrea atroviridis (strain ATCC 20476 / IMI 206040) TaxID=452589 RepID=G9P1W4_HYPAI|nr:uncharacterized protein TRIATDRAFT_35020 [Trichoderma atroviride IMI 206040]EHK43391.1 hypothetical protein TRIATDRAFT_35020 [Trichoderma atroviride IMI 206040]
MTIIQFLTRLIRGKPQTNSLILQLPVEIIVKILALLPFHSQLLVYQTCRPLRVITYEYFLTGKGNVTDLARATREDKLLYLTPLARSLPDRWVCVNCCKLHQIDKWDTPLHDTFCYLFCQDGMDTTEGYRVSRVGWPHYYPNHRHVELTLKYTRMEDIKRRHQKYLRRLLTPHHGPIMGYFDVAKGISGRISVYPKVVNERYLLLSIFTYVEGETKVSRQSIKFLEICSHISDQEICNIAYGWEKNINEAFETALSANNTQKFFSCGLCGTDYSIQASPERFVICVWQDFGPEGTIHDVDWRAMVCENGLVHHEPGSVRKLYGPHVHSGETY